MPTINCEKIIIKECYIRVVFWLRGQLNKVAHTQCHDSKKKKKKTNNTNKS